MHAETIRRIREAGNNHPNSIAIALDTKGPEIRTGMLVVSPFEFNKIVLHFKFYIQNA